MKTHKEYLEKTLQDKEFAERYDREKKILQRRTMNTDTHRGLIEETLCAVFLCAGFIAFNAGFPTWAKILWGKAAWDLLCAFMYYGKGKLSVEEEKGE